MKTIRILTIAIAMMGTSVMAATLVGDPFYCGAIIIQEGLTEEDVLQNCGEPTHYEGRNWYYNQGNDKFGIRVNFDRDGTVIGIEEVFD